MRFDVSQSGMGQSTSRATGQGHELDGDVESLVAALGSAGSACGGGPLAGALEALSGSTRQASQGMSERVSSTVNGAQQATGAFVEGDQEMQRNARQNEGQANFPASRFSSRG